MKEKTKVSLLIVITVISLIVVTIYVLVNGIENLQGIILFALLLGMISYVNKRIKLFKSGEVAEDEMSNMIKNKVGARTFYMSLYLWLLLVYIYDVDLEVITIGFSVMAILFALNYAIIVKSGSKH